MLGPYYFHPMQFPSKCNLLRRYSFCRMSEKQTGSKTQQPQTMFLYSFRERTQSTTNNGLD